jgi:hypothetical protein
MRTVALSLILLAVAAAPALAEKLGNFEIQRLMSEANATAPDDNRPAGNGVEGNGRVKNVGALNVAKSHDRSDLSQQLQIQLNEANSPTAAIGKAIGNTANDGDED